MHIHKKISGFVKKIADLFLSVMPYLFITLVIFSFDEVKMAFFTLLCAVLHEIGHFTVLFAVRRKFSLGGALFGLRIKPKCILSYGEEMAVAAAGPGINLVAFTIFIIPKNDGCTAFALINLFTALTNLLPIRGYDGYRIIDAALMSCGRSDLADKTLPPISFALVSVLAFLSLYFISRLNSGYWTFFIFIFFLLGEIKKDRRVVFARKKEISRDFRRF